MGNCAPETHMMRSVMSQNHPWWKALLSSANPLCVIEKAIAKFTQEQITSLYLRCEELLDKVTA